MAKPALPRRHISGGASRYVVFVPPNGDQTAEFPDPPFRNYWPTVEAHLRFTTQDTGNVENYVVCWREVEALEDPLFGPLGELPLRSWTRATAVRVLGALSNKVDGEPRSLSTLSCKVNALAAVFRRAGHDRHPLTDERSSPANRRAALLAPQPIPLEDGAAAGGIRQPRAGCAHLTARGPTLHARRAQPAARSRTKSKSFRSPHPPPLRTLWPSPIRSDRTSLERLQRAGA